MRAWKNERKTDGDDDVECTGDDRGDWGEDDVENSSGHS